MSFFDILFLITKSQLLLNEPEIIVPQEKMDTDLPGYAWDLLPFKEKPLDLYRSHVWHANFNEKIRTPYAAIYTSLGCVFGCGFCMINILNRTDNSEGVHAGDSRVMRFWSVDWVNMDAILPISQSNTATYAHKPPDS